MMANVVLQLEPLTCPSCIKKIEIALGKEQGVRKARILFNTSKAKVEYDEKKVDIDQLVEKLSKLGYAVLSQKQT